MIGRREFSVAGVTAIAAAAVSRATAFAEDRSSSKGGDAHHGAFRRCAEACGDCQQECDACASHCVDKLANGQKGHLQTLQTCLDCAAFCAAAARIVSRQGPFSDLICENCAEACSRCAKACERHPDDAMMKRCAEECHKCEKACREMLAHAKQS
ncbi:MAG: hypothetical protein IT428_19035 [Planctomycetaceae bacterium]|nr:hypothetical protein [Planctomycetaceae bacterium]